MFSFIIGWLGFILMTAGFWGLGLTLGYRYGNHDYENGSWQLLLTAIIMGFLGLILFSLGLYLGP